MRRLALALVLCALPAGLDGQQRPALPPSAQQSTERIREQQLELERLRQERRTLEQRMRDYQRNAQNVAAERQNLERQAQATARVVRSLDSQLGTLYNEVENVNASLVRTQDELFIKRAVLTRRVQEIYKRGPLYTLEALLSAESFGSLVARYKYLHLAAQRDRSLVQRVEQLNRQISEQRAMLVRLQGDVEMNRREKAEEEQRLRRLELQRGRTLAQIEAQQRTAQQRLQQISRDEQRLTNVITALEESRRRAEAAAARSGAAPSASALTTADLGRLDWPVEGSIVYRYGRVVNPNNTSITWNGIGISAPAGTPVKAIAEGEVVFAEQAGTYGLTMIVQHGGGAYSMYASLQEVHVRRGGRVTKGQTLGTVGQADPDLPPRLHFEIRPNGGRAVDPLDWLRRQPR
ncbi:peptidoglycan DD-metalloendopeptidase family protein [Pseudogemmatithrix spongiicola]|uniref:Peptidoglycan DD-metalloendopeptidase family protein n=1 Tax=Pseudogemmatithrix spongiicola TaxID=3062599 RepID=A0AA49JVP5_9BACT|nr:peptidoglycan DD-metalloendopeptidase family protein [Gemmatimonadaceae bacterium 'strain 138']WKW15614.1 peptidoglycan DD-metalloendopeptidase family protein [Gemmatimonadaceae bacterium 'strain 318']